MKPRTGHIREVFRAGQAAAGVPALRRDELAQPGTLRDRAPGTRLHRVKVMVDGRRRTKAEAAATFAHQPWASKARYAQASAGWYCWEVPE